MWFQKISIPLPWRDWKFQRGGEGGSQKPRKFQRGGEGGGGGSKAQEIPEGWRGGDGSKAQEIPEGWGFDSQINFQMVQFDSVLTYSFSC